MAGSTWTKAMRVAKSKQMTAFYAKQKSAKRERAADARALGKKSINEILAPAIQQNALDQGQTPAVDLRRVEQFNYRRGLLAALDTIIRELRDSY